jgi:hypothetical protein
MQVLMQGMLNNHAQTTYKKQAGGHKFQQTETSGF